MSGPSRALRAFIWERDGGRCGICSESVAMDDMHLDHVVTRSECGPDIVENLRATHARCNLRRPDLGHPVAGQTGRVRADTVGYPVRLKGELKTKLEDWAKQERRSLNAQLVYLLDLAVKAHESQNESGAPAPDAQG